MAGIAVLAVDIGGTKLAVALVGADGALLRSLRAPTDPVDPWPGLLALCREVVSGVAVDGVGIGCGGPMQWPKGLVSPLNIPAWRDFPLRDRLSQAYPGVPVRIHNDAVCVAIGEHWRGAGYGATNLLGLVVSTGVGGGLILGGRVIDGNSGNAGHIGHLVVEPDGPGCACGGRGCLEAVARGPAIVAWAAERGCPAADGRELSALAATGHPVALAALARSGAAVGLALASAAALLDLGVVVIGGGLSQAGEPFWAPLRAELAARAGLGFLAGLEVVPVSLGQEAGLVGAAALVLAPDRYAGDTIHQ